MTIRTQRQAAYIALAIALAVGPSPSAQEKPVVKTTIRTYTPGRIGSLEELWQRATAVVDADVAGQEPRDLPLPAGPPGREAPPPAPRIGTAFSLTVRSVQKIPQGMTLVPGQTITVVRTGGTRDRGTYIEDLSDNRFPLFKVGDRYVLFLLKTRQASEDFGVLSADGVFKIANGKVVPVGVAPVATRWSDKTTAEFLSELGRMRGGR